MLKEIESEETRLFPRIAIIGGILIRGARVPCPLPPWLRLRAEFTLSWALSTSEIIETSFCQI